MVAQRAPRGSRRGIHLAEDRGPPPSIIALKNKPSETSPPPQDEGFEELQGLCVQNSRIVLHMLHECLLGFSFVRILHRPMSLNGRDPQEVNIPTPAGFTRVAS